MNYKKKVISRLMEIVKNYRSPDIKKTDTQKQQNRRVTRKPNPIKEVGQGGRMGGMSDLS